MRISTFFILSNLFAVQEYNVLFKVYAYKGRKRPFFPRIQCYQMEIQISIDLQKFKCYSLLFEACVKTKRSDFFAGSNEIQISNF